MDTQAAPAAAAQAAPLLTPPRLWNPGAAVGWSLLLSPVFGAVLQMKNWQAMGETTKAFDAKLWAVGMAVAIFGVTLALVVLPQSRLLDALGHAVGLPLLIGWYYATAKAQVTRVAALYGRQYPRRGWGRPLLAGLGAVLGVILFILVLDALLESLR
ncbi:hypothetical protein ACS5PK_12140 [Roseateles sp. DB2]|uniref:hypothetical protein n=1 Tax=Roseateles sp. DB2 TaxID=3453717 RepID=UPI003EED0F06